MRMVRDENGPGWFCCDVPDHTGADGSVCGRGLNRGHGEAWRGGARDSGVSGLRGVWETPDVSPVDSFGRGRAARLVCHRGNGDGRRRIWRDVRNSGCRLNYEYLRTFVSH